MMDGTATTHVALYSAELGMWCASAEIAGRLVVATGATAEDAERRLAEWAQYVIVRAGG